MKISPFEKTFINLLGLVVDLTQTARESSLVLNFMLYKLSP